MKLRHLRLRHFRCFEDLDWTIAGDFLCLVGAGDSGKTTILDAIELVMSPRWNPVLDDGDFCDGDTTRPIVIEATIGDLSPRLISDGLFGLRLRGLSPSGAINDEPQDGDEPVLTLRLTVGSSLEPSWEVVTERHPEGAPIPTKERERLGVVRLGDTADRHLTWSRGSVLARLTGDTDEHVGVLADVGRKARSSVDLSTLSDLGKAAQRAGALAGAFGVTAATGFRPGVDPMATTLGSGGLSLHDGHVPMRRAGLGTRRLVTLAIHRDIARDGGVVLVDEVEHALEPFRIRRLLRELLVPTQGTPQGDQIDSAAHLSRRPSLILLSTHSPVVLGEVDVSHLRIVRRSGPYGRILTPKDDAQSRSVFRKNPEAFLARKIVVCEGRTELGFMRGLDEYWSRTTAPFAVHGVALADGGGSSTIGSVATTFADLGYPTAVLADSDTALDIPPSTLRSRGISVIQWADDFALEQRVFADLPIPGVVGAIELAMAEHGEDRIRAHVATALVESPGQVPNDVATWFDWRPDGLRKALGSAAKAKSNPWFKRVDLAASLGQIVATHLSDIPATDLATKIETLRSWIVSG